MKPIISDYSIPWFLQSINNLEPKLVSLLSIEHCNFTNDFAKQFSFLLGIREFGFPLSTTKTNFKNRCARIVCYKFTLPNRTTNLTLKSLRADFLITKNLRFMTFQRRFAANQPDNQICSTMYGNKCHWRETGTRKSYSQILQSLNLLKCAWISVCVQRRSTQQQKVSVTKSIRSYPLLSHTRGRH